MTFIDKFCLIAIKMWLRFNHKDAHTLNGTLNGQDLVFMPLIYFDVCELYTVNRY
jgi:hypothetical protein